VSFGVSSSLELFGQGHNPLTCIYCDLVGLRFGCVASARFRCGSTDLNLPRLGPMDLGRSRRRIWMEYSRIL